MEGKKYDAGKPRPDLLAGYASALIEECEVLAHGAKKYGDDNWLRVEDAEKRYLAAALRHIFAFMDGEVYDQESGFLHLAHARCSLGFLMEHFRRNTE